MVSRLLKLLAFIVFLSLFQYAVYAQEESAPQTRLSSKGLAFVNLSTSPANPVTGQLTVILIQFIDPQSKVLRGDIYYNFIIKNETSQLLTLPGGSTITGKVGIPYEFEKPGSYQVEIDLNDTALSKDSSASLDEVTFPIYVSQGELQTANQTVFNTTSESSSNVNIDTTNNDSNRLLLDGVFVAIAVGIVAFMVRKKVISKNKKSSIPE
ncbi:MAG: hypothetical protein KGH83_04365 [Thaumarchaeota archaeon]|nr:hypothetical protein [Nitrososphaerota archaeon]